MPARKGCEGQGGPGARMGHQVSPACRGHRAGLACLAIADRLATMGKKGHRVMMGWTAWW